MRSGRMIVPTTVVCFVITSDKREIVRRYDVLAVVDRKMSTVFRIERSNRGFNVWKVKASVVNALKRSVLNRIVRKAVFDINISATTG